MASRAAAAAAAAMALAIVGEAAVCMDYKGMDECEKASDGGCRCIWAGEDNGCFKSDKCGDGPGITEVGEQPESECMKAFKAGEAICKPMMLTNPLGHCEGKECSDAVQAAVKACGETDEEYYDEDEGEYSSIAKTLEMVSGVCTDDCFMPMATLVVEGCIVEGDDFNHETFCSEKCRNIFNDFDAQCADRMIPGDEDGATYAQVMGMPKAICEGCGKTFFGLTTMGCFPTTEEGQMPDLKTMCNDDCKGSYETLATTCGKEQVVGGDQTYGELAASMTALCDPCMQKVMGLAPGVCTDVCSAKCGDALDGISKECIATVDPNSGNPPAWTLALAAYASGRALCPPEGGKCISIPKADAEKLKAKMCI